MDQHPMTNGHHAGRPRPDRAASFPLPNRGAWRFVVLASVANFGLLRRHLGLSLADSLADRLVGVTFECDTPAEARKRTIVSTSSMPAGLTPAGIDAYVGAALAAGEDLYRLAEDALRDLDPTHVVTQDLCAVCAVAGLSWQEMQ